MSETKIHPTAVIDPGAHIGQGCEIGPFCVIGAHVELGDGCSLQHHVSLSGPSRLGRGNRFFAFSSIGQQTQDLKYTGEPTWLHVGDGNTFREFVTVHRGTAVDGATRIGSGGNFLAYSHIAHDCTIGDGVIFSNNGTVAGHVEVGNHAVIGGLTAIHQFCRIGQHALTGGCSKIVQDVPPFMIADGNPAEVRSYNKVGLERAGFSEGQIRCIKECYRLIYRSTKNVKQATEQICLEFPESAEAAALVAFLTSSKRGIIK